MSVHSRYHRMLASQNLLDRMKGVNQMTDEQVDRGAAALRQHMQGGKQLRKWSELPNTTKKKWRSYATIVLIAALGETK